MLKNMTKYICEICGKEFTSKKPTARVCSKKCYSKLLSKINYEKVKTRKCIVCGKEFKPVLLKCRRYSKATTCSKECALKLSEQSCMKRFGVKNASQSEKIKKQKEETCLKNFGAPIPFQSEKVKEKAKQTNLEKYGVEHPAQLKEMKEKVKQTNIERYGTEVPLRNEEIREKSRQTCLERYGTETPGQSEQVREKAKKTLIERYGVDNILKLPITREKAKKTMVERFGVKNYAQSQNFQDNLDSILEKQYQTKKKNHSFKTSKPEKEILKLLKIKFQDVEYQYKTKEYPFKCDFYVPELSLYIEYQGHFSHGDKPFEGTEEDLKVLALFESRNYKNAIDVWTRRDPIKRETARKNSLNWIEFFNMDQFMEWYDQQ